MAGSWWKVCLIELEVALEHMDLHNRFNSYSVVAKCGSLIVFVDARLGASTGGDLTFFFFCHFQWW